jgi:hypothetical protein
MFEVRGVVDVSPPLGWVDVASTGFMVIGDRGFPVVPAGRWAGLSPEDNNPFVFPYLVAAQMEVPADDRETFRQQLVEIVAAFPGHTFGAVSNVITFRGDLLDDLWRVTLNPDGTVTREVAALTWSLA